MWETGLQTVAGSDVLVVCTGAEEVPSIGAQGQAGVGTVRAWGGLEAA